MLVTFLHEITGSNSTDFDIRLDAMDRTVGALATKVARQSKCVCKRDYPSPEVAAVRTCLP